MEFSKNIPANLESVSQFSQGLEAQLSSLSINDRTTVLLAIHELLVNIVQHAYAGVMGEIRINMKLSNQQIMFVIEDDAQTDFELPQDISEPDSLTLPENGMGLFIIQQTFDAVKYEHFPKSNRWQLIRALGA